MKDIISRIRSSGYMLGGVIEDLKIDYQLFVQLVKMYSEKFPEDFIDRFCEFNLRVEDSVEIAEKISLNFLKIIQSMRGCKKQTQRLLVYSFVRHNRPEEFSDDISLPAIAYLFQQGGQKFYENLKKDLRKMPKNILSFLEQYRWLEENTRPNINGLGNQALDRQDGGQNVLVFYFRQKAPNSGGWQGSDLIQSGFIIRDIMELLKRKKMPNFAKLIVVPRADNDLPFFVEEELKKEFGSHFVEECFEFSNNFKKYEGALKANFIELVDGCIYNNRPVIAGGIFLCKERKREINENVIICPEIFWPGHDWTDTHYIDSAQRDTGLATNQAPSLKDVRMALIRKVLDLDARI